MKKNKQINLKAWELPVLAVMFLFAVSVFNKGGYIFAAMAVVMLLLNIRNIKINFPVLWLILFSVIYTATYFVYNDFNVTDLVIYLLGPWTAYLMGHLFVTRSKKENAFYLLILVLTAGMCLHGFLNVIAYLSSDYYETYSYLRLSVDFWRGDLVSVTTTGMLYTFATGLSMGQLFSQKPLKQKLPYAVIFAGGIAATVLFANKTLLVIVAMLFAWYLLTLLFSTKVSSAKKVGAVIVVVIFLALLSVMWGGDVGGLRTWISELKIFSRLQTENDSRFRAWMVIFENFNFLRYPFGGNHMFDLSGKFLHNLWLDVYDTAGAVPFVALLIFTVLAVGRYREYRKTTLRLGYKNEYMVFQYLMLATLLNCMVEPILEGNPYFFLIVLIFLGAMEARTAKLKKQEGTGTAT